LKLAVNLPPLTLKNPVIIASGTLGYGDEFEPIVKELGAFVCKGTTLNPRPGNPQPRLAETPCGLLNSIGLENIGVRRLIEEKAPIWAGWETPVAVNIAAETIEEYAEIASLLYGVPGVSALELNISCPNIQRGGIEFGTDPQMASEVVRAVKSASPLPLWVKLSPNVTDIMIIAQAVAEAGADAVTLINTLRGMAIDIKSRRPTLSTLFGGLSGPAIKPIALYLVYQVVNAIDITVIGCGGIASAEDALQFLMAGAKAVQVGTANLTNPYICPHIVEGIKQFMEREGIEDINDIIGIARIK